jgi:hypothetical protein
MTEYQEIILVGTAIGIYAAAASYAISTTFEYHPFKWWWWKDRDILLMTSYIISCAITILTPIVIFIIYKNHV